jgi:acetyl esterase/lipase
MSNQVHAVKQPLNSSRLRAVLQLIERYGSVPGETISKGRAKMEALASNAPLASDVSHTPVDVQGVPAEWVKVHGVRPGRAILYLHGGSYIFGSINTHRELASRLARAACARVLVLDYRLAPEHPYPAAVADALTACDYLVDHGTDPADFVIAGDSAGGGLALATLLSLRDAGSNLPAATACLCPWTDLAGTGQSMITNAGSDPMIEPGRLMEQAQIYLAGASPRTPLASPLYADLAGLPPLLIQVGSTEILLDDATRLAERAQTAGVSVELEVWPGMIHCWQAFAWMLPQGQQAIGRIGAFVRRHAGARAHDYCQEATL